MSYAEHNRKVTNQRKGLKMEQRVNEIIADIIPVKIEEIVPTANLAEDLGCDSLDCVELTMAIEEEYQIEVVDEDAEKIKTVQDIYDYLKTRLNS